MEDLWAGDGVADPWAYNGDVEEPWASGGGVVDPPAGSGAEEVSCSPLC